MAATNDLVNDEEDIKIRDTRGDTPIFTKYFQVMNSPLKTKKVNPPDIFFEPPSLVTDFYNGNVRHLLSLLSEKDVSLVMYYAPWDASSLQSREEFETVAKFYHNEVFFAAINCWWPEGECRKKFSIPSYPIVLAYVHEMGIIRYDGPIISTYLISFLDSILTPLVPLHHKGELLDLLAKHEGVLVGYFEFKDGSYPKGYRQYFHTALKALSNDPYRRICFAVVTNKPNAETFKLKSNIQLFLWNSVEVYTGELGDHTELLTWTFSKIDFVSSWLSPPGAKSSMLSENIENNPALILFTPRNVLLEYSPYYNLLKEVSLDYNNCNKSNFVESIIHRMVLKRHVLQEEFSKIIEKCHKNTSSHDPNVCRQRPDLCDLTCCQSTNLNLKLNQACSCRACLHHIVENVNEMKLSECENTLKLVVKNFDINRLGNFKRCNDIEVSFPVKFGRYKQLSFHCELETENSAKSLKKQLTDQEMAELKDDLIVTMIQNNEKRLCHRLRYALNYSELNFPSFPNPNDATSWLSNFTGLRCQTNRTLTFIAMDAILYHSFAENLGIDVSKNHHQTSAVIVETTQENQFVLDGQVTKKALVEFIKNYTMGSLSRHLRMPVRKLQPCEEKDGANVCVDEVTTATFFDVVLAEKDVVLLYYAPWCGPCQSISHIFLSVADYFSNVEDIKFARINGEENDLPWEYTVEKYPTIIFFPVKRKSDSVEFPPHLLITMSNLLHFVLVHTQPKVRWMVAMEMCNRDCIAHNLIMSSKELRRLFREQKGLINDLHFAQQLIYRPKKTKLSSAKQKGGKEPSVNYLKSVYLKTVIERIHKKRRQIHQALQLQVVLRKKRDIYFRENGRNDANQSRNGKTIVKQGKKGKHVDFRQKKVKDEL